MQPKNEVEAPILAKLDVENFYLQGIARLRAVDRDRAGENMRSRTARRFGEDLTVFGQYGKAGALRRQILQPAGNAVDRDCIAGLDRQHRRDRGVVIAPMHRVGPRRECVVSAHCSSS